MIYLSCQPAIPKFLWEVEVYVNNFLDMGINPNDIHVVLGVDRDVNQLPSDWLKLQKHFTGVNFVYFSDTRPTSNRYHQL